MSEQHLRSFITEVTAKFNRVTTADSTAEDEDIALLLEAGYDAEEQKLPVTKKLKSTKKEPVVPVALAVNRLPSKKVLIKRKKSIKKDVFERMPPAKKDAKEPTVDKLKDEVVDTYEDDQTDLEHMHEDVLDVEYQVVDEEHVVYGSEDVDEEPEEIYGGTDEINENYNEYEEIIIPSNDYDVYDSQEMLNEEHIEEEHLLDSYVESVDKKRIKLRSPKSPKSHVSCLGLHMCLQCNKDFSTKTNLLRHMQTHDGNKPYQCNICGNSFTQNGSLKQHMHIHTGIRPFVCNFCNRGFTQSKSLVFHTRRHTGEKPFTCDKCGLSFRQKDGLKVNETFCFNTF